MGTKKGRHGRKIYKWLTIAIIVIVLVIWLFPSSLVCHPDTCTIVSILYRADDWDTLRYYYPITSGENDIDEEAILQLLHRYRALRELFPSTFIDAVPNGAVTLWITVSDGGVIKSILLGELNRLDVGQGNRTTKYDILSADSLLNEMLNVLEISEDMEFPEDTWIVHQS